jgi:hypothetical protein
MTVPYVTLALITAGVTTRLLYQRHPEWMHTQCGLAGVLLGIVWPVTLAVASATAVVWAMARVVTIGARKDWQPAVRKTVSVEPAPEPSKPFGDAS